MNGQKLGLTLQTITVVLLAILLWQQSHTGERPVISNTKPPALETGVSTPDAALLSDKLAAIAAALARLERNGVEKSHDRATRPIPEEIVNSEHQQEQFQQTMELAQASIAEGVLTRLEGEQLRAELSKLSEAQRDEVFLMVVRSINEGRLKPEPGSGF